MLRVSRKFYLLIPFFLLFTVLLLLFWPGAMTNDSFGWLIRSRSGEFNDIQSIGPTLFNQYAEKIFTGPFLYIVFDLLLIICGGYLVAINILQSKVQQFVFVLLFIAYPPVLSILGVMWRDITGLGLTLITFGLILNYVFQDKKNGFLKYILSVCFVTYIGVLFRDNHVAGIFPFLVFFISVYLSKYILNPYIRNTGAIFISFFVCGLITVIGMKTTNHLSIHKSYKQQVSYNYTLSYISQKTNYNYFPKSVYPKITMSHIDEKLKQGFIGYWIAYSRKNDVIFFRIENNNSLELLKKATFQAIEQNPDIYLQLKARHVYKNLDLDKNFLGGIKVYGFSNIEDWSKRIEINFPSNKPIWSKQILDHVKQLSRSRYVNNPNMALLSALAVLIVFWKVIPFKIRIIASLGFISGLFHHIAIALVVSDYAYRYGHQSIAFSWLVMMTVMFGVICKIVQILVPGDINTVNDDNVSLGKPVPEQRAGLGCFRSGASV